MQDAFFTAFLEKFGAEALLIFVTVGVIIFISYKCGSWMNALRTLGTRVETLEKIVESLPEMKATLGLIYQIVNPNALTRANSPISLTPVGQEVAERVGASNILKKYLISLVEKVELQAPKNAYDIQQAAFSIVKADLIDMLSTEETKKLKDEAFNRGILFEEVISIFGILLRNQILEQKGMPISDVDKHDSSKN